jgi:hypothetical protein
MAADARTEPLNEHQIDLLRRYAGGADVAVRGFCLIVAEAAA